MYKKCIALACLPLAFGVVLPAAENFPVAEISNGEIKAKVYLPDAQKGFYRSTRFDWSGVIGSLEYKGHNYYGPWFTKITDVYDFGYEGDDVISAPFTAMVGPGEEFGVLGRLRHSEGRRNIHQDRSGRAEKARRAEIRPLKGV
jgi:hypothetical protein